MRGVAQLPGPEEAQKMLVQQGMRAAYVAVGDSP
jgi:hypothetical protein